jgi:hypothetical protein
MVPWIAAQGAVLALVGWQGRLLDVERRQQLDAKLQIAGDAVSLAVIAGLWFAAAPESIAVPAICMAGILHSVAWLAVVYRVTSLGVGCAFGLFLLLSSAACFSAGLAAVAETLLGPLPGALAAFVTTAALVLACVVAAARRL